MKAKTYLIINRYQRSRIADRRPYVTPACEREDAVKKTPKPVFDDEEEEVPIKRRGPYGTKKCGCPFKLKCEQMATSDNWQLFVHDGRHNHKIGLKQTKQFRNSHVPPHMFYLPKIYNIVAKIKKNKMQGRNTVEEIIYLSAKGDYTVFYRNCEESNELSDTVIAHPTSIAMIRMWPYVLIMDTTYKTNKYNMPLLEAVGMTPTDKNFTVATSFLRNEKGSTYRWSSNVKLLRLRAHWRILSLKKSLSNRISHWVLKKIWDEIKRAHELSDDAQNKCGHYLGKSHGLPCAGELLSRYIQRTQWFDGPAPEEHWLEIPDHLYVIVNTFNFCVVLIAGLGSTTTLPLYSNSNSPSGTLLQLWDRCPLPPFNLQWEFHRDIQLRSLEEPYSVRIANWVRQQLPLVRTRGPIYVEVD
ncbi:hypothetical protein M9H77_35642 [Catharanthus roseus]|uniref:Uncharacterized protein n=1 Tax=Catharanthus roseus TaxID=4058 RepID=A0ACB9ZTU5_CATRO|nr:hypothetical protein M9H77_35642 [Catharanthus roseus]